MSILSGLFSVEGVAQEIGRSELEVMRLISKGRLPATRIGAGGPWRIVADDLAKWVGDGADDAAIGPVKGGWVSLGNTDGHAASAFLARVTALIVTPDEPPATDRVVVAATPAMIEAGQAAPQPPARIKGQKIDARMPTIAAAYWAHLMLSASRSIKAPGHNFAGSITNLYSGPDTYQAIIAEAQARTLAGGISVSRVYPNAQVVSFVVRHDSLVNRAALSRIADMAF